MVLVRRAAADEAVANFMPRQTLGCAEPLRYTSYSMCSRRWTVLTLALALMGCEEKALEEPLPKHPVKVQQGRAKLIASGSEPRERLRYDFEGGETQRVTVRGGIGSEDLMLSADVKLGSEDDGVWGVGFTAGREPKLAYGRMLFSVTDTGRVQQAFVENPRKADEGHPGGYAGLVAPLPLPDEAIGVGGTWQLERSLDEHTVEIWRVELQRRDGRRLELQLNVSQRVTGGSPAQRFVPMAGSGKAIVDLRYPVPSYQLTQRPSEPSSLPSATTAVTAIPPAEAPANPLSDSEQMSEGQRKMLEEFQKSAE